MTAKLHSAALPPFPLQLVKFDLPVLLGTYTYCMSDRGMWGDFLFEAGSIGPTVGRDDTEARTAHNYLTFTFLNQ